MSEQRPEYVTDALDKILDQAHELAAANLDHPEFLEFEELEKQARKQLAEMRQINEWALKLGGRIIDLKYEPKDGLSLLAKSYLWTSAT